MALAVSGLIAGYSRDLPIVNDIDLVARDGLVTLIIGPNGAGKSTILKTVYGHLKPMAGSVSIDGLSLLGLRPNQMLRQGVAFLLQGRSTFPTMTVAANLELGAWIIRHDRVAKADALAQVYARFPLLARKRKLPAGLLSGGEQRMLEIARLTMSNPKVLLLDEPSVGLMPRLVDEVYEEIRKLKDQKFTILMVDQNIRKSIEIADHVYVVKLGRIDREGPQDTFAGSLPDIVKEWI